MVRVMLPSAPPLQVGSIPDAVTVMPQSEGSVMVKVQVC